MKKICQTCEHWGWTNWDETGECWHPVAAAETKPANAEPTDFCDGWRERKDKSEDGPNARISGGTPSAESNCSAFDGGNK